VLCATQPHAQTSVKVMKQNSKLCYFVKSHTWDAHWNSEGLRNISLCTCHM